MKAFARLYTQLDETTSTNAKLAAMQAYFNSAAPADAAWAVYFLSGHKPRQVVPTRKLLLWAAETTRVPEWLAAESLDAVGDLAETVTLLLPDAQHGDAGPLHVWVEQKLLPLRDMAEAEQRLALEQAWHALDTPQRLVWNKLIAGSFRVGVSQQLVMRALAAVSGLDIKIIAHRLMGAWTPSAAFFEALIAKADSSIAQSQPYPFFLCYALDQPVETLGSIDDWLVEWKWDGIRAQLVRRAAESFLWSRGEELIGERFPEIIESAAALPDGVVIDGEILSWANGKVLPFARLQRRIGRKKLTRALLEETPAVLMAYDLLENEGQDIRNQPFCERRAQLEQLLRRLPASGAIVLSPLVEADDWPALARLREQSRQRQVEGFVLKQRQSTYGAGRRRGPWWKWKIDPYSIDAVLIYAQSGHGRRASIYTDYTFGIWRDGALVPFAKAYSGLSDEEIREVDRFVRANTIERFGPVRAVKPELVFELAFEAIQRSTRHKSGIAVRFPRIARWRRDKTPLDADSLTTIEALLDQHAAHALS